jgi:hypothetical protein
MPLRCRRHAVKGAIHARLWWSACQRGAHFVRFGWSTAQVTSISSAARPSGLISPLKSFTATALPSCSILHPGGWLCCAHLGIHLDAVGLGTFALHCAIRRLKEDIFEPRESEAIPGSWIVQRSRHRAGAAAHHVCGKHVPGCSLPQ